MFRLLFLLFFAMAGTLRAEPILELRDGDNHAVIMGEYTGVFEDKLRKFDINDVLGKDIFHFDSYPVKHFAYTNSRIWVVLKVKNQSNVMLSRYVEVELPGAEAVEFYRQRLGQDKVEIFRETLGTQSGIGSYNSVFEITIPPNAEEIWYMSHDSYYAMVIKSYLHSQRSLLRQTESKIVAFNFYAGFILFAAIFSLFLYSKTSHQPFLFYSLTIIFFHFLFYLTNFGFLTGWWEGWKWFQARSILMFIELSLFFGYLFFMKISNLKDSYPKVAKFSIVFPIKSLTVIFVSCFYFDAYMVDFTVKSTFIMLLFFIGFGLALGLKGQRAAIYFVIGWGVAFVCNAIYAFVNTVRITEMPYVLRSFLSQELLLIANVIEVIFMALAIGDQFQQFKTKSQIEKEDLIRLQKDLDDAEAVQAAFFRQRSLPSGVSIWAESHSAEKTGGDWYGYLYIEQSQKLYLSIIDVTGHGVRSALVTGAVHGAFYSVVPILNRNFDSAQKRLQYLAQSMNQVVRDTGRQSDLLATMTLIEVDLESCTLYYTSLGHGPSILLRNGASEMIHCRGSLLGFHDEVEIKLKKIKYQTSDILLLYTDGWLENRSPGDRPLSFKRFASYFASSRTLEDLKKAFFSLKSETLGLPVQDDYTLLAIQFDEVLERSILSETENHPRRVG